MLDRLSREIVEAVVRERPSLAFSAVYHIEEGTAARHNVSTCPTMI